jgi:hypothetical protein
MCHRLRPSLRRLPITPRKSNASGSYEMQFWIPLISKC